eukprot:113728-Prymnesium_polylepis.1
MKGACSWADRRPWLPDGPGHVSPGRWVRHKQDACKQDGHSVRDGLARALHPRTHKLEKVAAEV